MAFVFQPHTGSVRATARLNLRRGSPTRSAPVAMLVEPETLMAVSAIGRGEMVAGNDLWYASDSDLFFWSGACGSFQPMSSGGTVLAASTSIDVARRSNGTILPLDDPGLRRSFGDFTHTSHSTGRITIHGNWVAMNIGTLDTPELEPLGFPRLTLHQKAIPSFRAVLDAIKDAGHLDLLLTCAGTFVPRHKGWNPSRGLSSHSWGAAIDFNVAWNGYGVTPAARGAVGSVRELVPIFEAHGFAWGGYFSPPNEDGMHFELARRDL
jgi:D-alanyl-D-alanine carboxypeptidase